MARRSETNDTLRTAALTALAVTGPLFGIATQVWGQALLLLGLAVLLIIAPPRRSPGALWCALFAGIAVVALTAFLPVRWFGTPEWRKTLTGEYRIELPGTLSPQPWVSLHAICLLFAGAIFALYVITHPWSPQLRRQAARWYTGGVVCLALIALGVGTLGWTVPFWPKVLNSVDYFGIFPNRNQTANLFALAGIMATALAFDGFEKGRKTALMWAGSVVVLGMGIVQTYSRAGCLIFFAGIAAYGLLSFFLSTSAKGGGITIAGFALLLTGFFIFGGGTFQRFQTLATDAAPDFRVVLQKDAVHLASTAPWLGQGLGNFAPVFAMFREASIGDKRAIHPESDWLWVAVEMGWPAMLMFAGACLLWLRQSLPLSLGSDRALRSAALVCGMMFLVHSLVDVSGHRPGTAWPAFFLAALALHPKRSIQRRDWVAPVFRVLGLMLAGIAGWWFASVFSERVSRTAPTMATAAMLEDRAFQQNANGEHDAAVVSANEALRIMPLNADLYFQRGIGRLVEAFSVWGTAKDFATARFLDPHWVELYFAQGKAWTEAGQPEFAYEAWLEGLRHAGTKGPALYDQMLLWTGKRPAMHTMLARLSHNDPDYFLTYLRHSGKEESDLQISQLVQAEPELKSFSAEQRNMLFSAWFRQGDHSSLFATLRSNPEWQQEGWRWLALLHAERKEFRSACELIRNSIKKEPTIPKVAGTKSVADLEKLLRARPDDIDLGLQLHTAQLSAGKKTEAMETLRSMQALPNHPAYLAFIEAGQHEESGNWEDAWKAWRMFAGRELQ